MPDRFDIGMETRRAVLGNAHVDRAEAAKTEFDADFQRFITEGAWGSVWSRPGLSQRERSLITIALLAALGHDEEVAPVPFTSSSTLSGVAFLTKTNSVELPGFMFAASSFINLSSMPTSVRAPETAPAVAPIAMPRSGFKKSIPTSAPQKPPLTAPAAVTFTA